MPTYIRTFLYFYIIFHFRIYEYNIFQFFEIRLQQFSLLTYIKVRRTYQIHVYPSPSKNRIFTVPQSGSTFVSRVNRPQRFHFWHQKVPGSNHLDLICATPYFWRIAVLSLLQKQFLDDFPSLQSYSMTHTWSLSKKRRTFMASLIFIKIIFLELSLRRVIFEYSHLKFWKDKNQKSKNDEERSDSKNEPIKSYLPIYIDVPSKERLF